MPAYGLPTLAPLALLLAACSSWAFDWQGRGGDLGDYHRAHAEDVGARFSAAADVHELVAMLRHSRVLWLGDHHRHLRLHARHLWLLDHLHRQGMRLSLGLEAIGSQDQVDVDAFLAGRIDLAALGARAHDRWAGSWLCGGDVDAEHYRQLLDFARRTRTPVFALEPTPRPALDHRDARIAATVADAAAAAPDRLIVVVVGESHLFGNGRLVERTGLPGVALGAVPSAALRRDGRRRATGVDLLRSSGGLWFFADLL